MVRRKISLDEPLSMSDINLIRKRMGSGKLDEKVLNTIYSRGLPLSMSVQEKGKKWLMKNRKKVKSYSYEGEDDRITEIIANDQITDIKLAGLISQADVQNNIGAQEASMAYGFYLPIYRVYTSNPNLTWFEYTMAFPDKYSQRRGYTKNKSGTLIYVMAGRKEDSNFERLNRKLKGSKMPIKSMRRV